MATTKVPFHPALPTSHYFLTISRGDGMRTFAVRSPVVQAMAIVLPVLFLCLVAETLCLVFHDDLMASLLAHESQIRSGYEDRIAALRTDNEQQTDRLLAEQAKVETKVRDLFSRAAKLENRAEAMASLAVPTESGRREAAVGGPRPRATAAPGRAGPRVAAPGIGSVPAPDLPEGVMGYAPTRDYPAFRAATPRKPRPETGPPPMGDEALARTPFSSRNEDAAAPLPDRLRKLTASLDLLEREQVGDLLRIGSAARGTTEHLRGVLEDAGLAPERFLGKEQAMGGPFVPLLEEGDSPFGRAARDLKAAVAIAGRLRDALAHVPLSAPFPGNPEVTSPFGARLDPFLGRPALHPGIDLREDYGVEVKATAPGRVVTAGAAGGYGNLVEIDHGFGLATRYAHLSSIVVADGQEVAAGSVLGQVGMSGRTTGPHLHYEIRIDGEPVDPARFLAAGAKLQNAELP